MIFAAAVALVSLALEAVVGYALLLVETTLTYIPIAAVAYVVSPVVTLFMVAAVAPEQLRLSALCALPHFAAGAVVSYLHYRLHIKEHG